MNRKPFAPQRNLTWRTRRSNESLPDKTDRTGPDIKGEDRCGAIGLQRGDCDMPRLRKSLTSEGSVYCYWHDKVQRGLATPFAEVFGMDVGTFYPAWPLPAEGYKLVYNERKAA